MSEPDIELGARALLFLSRQDALSVRREDRAAVSVKRDYEYCACCSFVSNFNDRAMSNFYWTCHICNANLGACFLVCRCCGVNVHHACVAPKYWAVPCIPVVQSGGCVLKTGIAEKDGVGNGSCV